MYRCIMPPRSRAKTVSITFIKWWKKAAKKTISSIFAIDGIKEEHFPHQTGPIRDAILINPDQIWDQIARSLSKDNIITCFFFS